MPVSSQIGFVFRHYDDVAFTGLDEEVASRAHISLSCRVWLYWHHDLVVKSAQPANMAQSTSPIADAIATTTSRTSVAPRCCFRNGLKPMTWTVVGASALSSHPGWAPDSELPALFDA